MRWVFTVVMLAHGAIHLMGFTKAFGWAELPQLTQPISRAMGTAWLLAALMFAGTAVLYVGGSRVWWALGLAAVVLSQAVILTAWADARFGTLANLLIAAVAGYGLASQGPLSLRAEYQREVEARLSSTVSAPLVTEADLAPLPSPVQRYVRLAGAIGQPRVHRLHATWQGRIRGGPEEPWMVFTAVQHNFLDEPARFFFMDATRGGVPVDVFHDYRGHEARMRVRLASLLPLVSASGPDLTRAETVTLFNDLCILAPAALIDPAIRWEAVDDRTVRARYTAGANTIGATLHFNESGDLIDFTTEDRLAQSSGGAQWTRQPWSTPLRDYRRIGPWRVATRGEGRWHPPTGEFVYIELELLDLRINGATSGITGE